MKLFFSLIIWLCSSGVLAQDIYSQGGSQWCLIRDENEICNYATIEGCYDIALVAGGYCRENAKRAGLKGDLDWCVVSSNGRSCSYLSQESCINAARRIDGSGVSSGCVYNLEMALQRSLNRNEFLGFIQEDDMANASQSTLTNQLKEAQAEEQARQQQAPSN